MPKAWHDIRTFYRELSDSDRRVESMLRLVEQIEASRYASGLYAWTSMVDLCIAQVPEPYDGPYLRISLRHDGRVEFRYIDTAIEARQWHRVVPGERAFSRLQRFFEQLHWFAGERKSNP